MKIALPVAGGLINQHFGQSKEFLIVETDGVQVKEQHTVSAAQLQHNHGGLAGLLHAEGVETVVLGGIGPYALEALEKSGLKVISGVHGDVLEAARACARGELVSTGAVCGHHHGPHASGHGA